MVKPEDAKKLAARLRDPECYADACDEAADEIVKMAQKILASEELIRHCWVHSGYPHNGYLYMDTPQKMMYCKCIKAVFTPLRPDFT